MHKWLSEAMELIVFCERVREPALHCNDRLTCMWLFPASSPFSSRGHSVADAQASEHQQSLGKKKKKILLNPSCFPTHSYIAV